MAVLSRITRPQIAIIAAVLTALAAGGIYFFLIKPLGERRAAAQGRYDTANARAIQRGGAEADALRARQEVATAQAKWARYDRKYMPNINISNLMTAMQQVWREQNGVLGPLTVRFLRRDRRVRVAQQSIAVAAPPTDPNAVNTNVIVLPLGSVSVVGSFRNVLSHAERWNAFERLVLVDNLTLAGNSPRLVGQYTLTAFLFTRGEAGPAIPSAGGGGAGGGGMGGYPGSGANPL